MDSGLKGRVVVVTGAASGIGRATALRLAGEGADLGLVDVDVEGLAAVAAEIGEAVRVVRAAADLSTADGVAQAFATVLDGHDGRVDALVNNAGVARPMPFDDLTDAAFEATLQLNFFGYLRAIRHVLGPMRAAGRGAIVNVASDLGRQPAADPLDYCVSKTAVLAMTKGLARGEGSAIRVNAVAPGPVWTPLWTRPGGFGDTFAATVGAPPREAVHQLTTRDLPLARLGTPEEVANVIVFLASDLAAYVTGSVWGVDGGSIRGF